MLRHIAWFNEAAIEPLKDGLTSVDATVRRRCLAPARALEELGVECSVFGNLRNADPVHVAKHLQKLQTDIVVIGQVTGPTLLKLARTAKHLGCYVVADFGDDKTLSPEGKQLAAIADQIVVGTDDAAIVMQDEGLEAFVIPDCDEKDNNAPDSIAHMWFECFRRLKMKPPACANMNEPVAGNG